MNSKESNQQLDELPNLTENASNYALRVALQTMKERCQSLQQRLVCVEDENLELRKKISSERSAAGISVDASTTQNNSINDVHKLQDHVDELSRQKSQLSQHITMIASENRQLWSRLSKLTKDNQEMKNSLLSPSSTAKQSTTNNNCNNTTNTHQNLIRSKTFTQNAPNPLLRQKINLDRDDDDQEIGDQLSLEEISLKVLNEFLEGKAEIEKKCTEFMEESQLSASKNDTLGFGYLNDEQSAAGTMIITSNNNDIDLKNNSMIDIKKELLRQQSDLKVALTNFRKRKIPEICSSCKYLSKKPNTADKNLDTNDITMAATQNNSTTIAVANTVLSKIEKIDIAANSPPDYLERKRIADTLDKMCPMCERIYLSTSSFDEFQEHVESHFIDDTELDMSSIERNFDFVSHTVGNF